MSKGYELRLIPGQQPPAVRMPEYEIVKDGEQMMRGTPATLIFFLFTRLESVAAETQDAFKYLNELRDRVGDLEQASNELNGQLNELREKHNITVNVMQMLHERVAKLDSELSS